MLDGARGIEKIYSRVGYKEGGLRIWGHMYVDTSGRTPGGWLINSWSELASPYWQCQFHWFDSKTKKLHNAQLNLGLYGESNISTSDEEADIEPARAKFIREHVDRWELEWLKDQANL
jgi:hypothetical protein